MVRGVEGGAVDFGEHAVVVVIRAGVVQFVGHGRNSVAPTFPVASACKHVGDVFFTLAQYASGTQVW